MTIARARVAHGLVPAAMTAPLCTTDADKAYARLRDYLKHEDSLINWRLTWNFGLQTLLLGGFGYLYRAAGPGKTSELDDLHHIGELGMPILGLFLGFASYVGVVAAQRSIAKLSTMWSKAEVEDRSLFPNLAGGGSWFASAFGIYASLGPIFALLITWTVLLYQQHRCAAVGIAILLGLMFAATIGWQMADSRSATQADREPRKGDSPRDPAHS